MPFARNSMAILAALIASAFLAGPAQALTYNVNRTNDADDFSPGDGQCDVDRETAGEQCTLRAAIQDANFQDTSATQFINVPAGTYGLSAGVLTINANIALSGASARTTVITQTGVARVFEIDFSTTSISGVTISNGTAGSINGFFGGNIRAQSSDLTLTNSTITGGSGSSGGGISNVTGTLTVRGSTIFGNRADTGGGDAGAIQNFGDSLTPALVTIENSTISGNSARLAGGIISGGNAQNSVTVRNSTIASNASNLSPPRGGGGGLLIGSGTATVGNSIVALNTSVSAGQENCSADQGATITSLGNNIESGTECGFNAPGDLQGTNPLLGPLQNAGGPTDTRPLLSGSPAIDAGNNATCLPADQRGVPRPQGLRCDIGAYELVRAAQSAPPDTVIVSGPSPVTRDRTPTFSFSASRPGTTFECSLDDGPFLPCSSPFTAPASLRAGPHVFRVRARDASGNVDPTPAGFAFAIPARLSDLPAPVLGRTVNAEPVSGEVTVAIPAGADSAGDARTAQKGLRFIPLREARQLPVGTFFNTRKGRVRLQTATTRRGRRQAGVFSGGLFQTLQSRRRSARGLTELRLKGSSFRRCARAGHGSGASTARHSKRRIRRLRGNARGRFRTRGRYSAATVRGTIWEVSDRCDGTLTKVSRGRVSVRDFRRRRNVLVRAGKSYLARVRR